MTARFVSVAYALVALFAFGVPAAPSYAQLRDPQRITVAVADCITATMPDEIVAPAYVEQIDGGWRVVIPLRGQPDANRQVQSPPPAEDALAWFDLQIYPDEQSLPDDWNAISPFRVDTPIGIYIVSDGGYFWFRPRGVTQRCLENAAGGVYVPNPR